MPVTTIKATSAMYGNSNNGAYTNTATNHMYVGYTGGTGFHYRSYLKFPSLKSIAAIGNAAITITQVKLFCRRTDQGGTTITGGPSSSAAWNAALAGSLNSATWSTATEWKSVTITNQTSLTAIAGYTGAWYIHLRGTQRQNYIRLASTGSSYVPYIQVTWEYAQKTITFKSGTETVDSIVCNGTNAVTLSIDSSIYANDSTYAIRYSIGDQSGTIGASSIPKTGDTTTVTWTPGTELLSEITNSETGDVTINMTSYYSNGNVYRTEKAILSLEVPSTVKMAVPSQLVQVQNGYTLSQVTYGLTGRSYLGIRPIVSEANLYGAQLVQATVTVTQPDTSEVEITWSPDEFEEYNNSTLIGASKQTAILDQAGTVTVSVEAVDSRGRNADMTGYSPATVTVLTYSPPEIVEFDVDRIAPQLNEDDEVVGYSQDDTGAYAWVNANIVLHSIMPTGSTERQTCSFTLNVMNTSTGVSAGSRTGTLTLSNSVTAVLTNDYSHIFPTALGTPPTMDIGSSFEFTITITDAAGVTATAYSTIVPGRANMHLAGSKYGVAFGGFSKGTSQSPLLESYYPAKFYNGITGETTFDSAVTAAGGIEGVTNYVSGEVLTGGTWIDGKPIYRYVHVMSRYSDKNTGDQPLIFYLPSTPDALISIRGAVRTPGSNNGLDWHPVAYSYFNNRNWTLSYVTHNNEVYLSYGPGYYQKTLYIITIVEYTKP